jgi:hypothetical protein
VIRPITLFLAVAPLLPAGEPNPARPASPIINPEKEGRELAAKLCTYGPSENARFTGVLEITSSGGRVRSVPVLSTVTVAPPNWLVVYGTTGTNNEPEETLAILHAPAQSNVYTLALGSAQVSPTDLTRPFAGSDFWLMDLGLEFFHWPQQRVLRSEMSRSRPCRVLESVAPGGEGNRYGRVVSWIDLETGGLIQAEAYDRQNKLLKKFALGSLKKVAGEWRLRDMRIKNVRTGQQTELKFDLQKAP